MVELVPWLELGPDGEAEAAAVNGLRLYAQAGVRTAIVSGGPTDQARIRGLRSLIGGLELVHGLKTSPTLGHAGFGNVRLWRQLAHQVAAVPSPVVLFEHESALKAYIDGDAPLDVAGLRAGLRLLPRDRQYWWYPSGAGAGQTLNRYLEVWHVVTDVLRDVRAVNHAEYFGPSAVESVQARAISAYLGHNQIYLSYWQPVHRLAWRHEELAAAMTRAALLDELIVYPGADNWVTFAGVVADYRAALAKAVIAADAAAAEPEKLEA